MKEMYKSPELEEMSLASAERLANDQIDYDQLAGNGNGGKGSSTVGDIVIDIPLK